MTGDDTSLAKSRSTLVGRANWLAPALVAWALLRLFALLVLIYVFKDSILNALGDPEKLTLLVIGITGTPVARLLFAVVFGGALAVLCWGLMRGFPRFGYWIAVGVAALLTFVVFHLSETALTRALPVIAVLAANLLPDRYFERLLPSGSWRACFMGAAVGVAEVFFFRRFISWAAELWTGKRIAPWNSLFNAAVAAFIASGIGAILLQPTRIAAIEQGVRMSPSARIVAEGNFNSIGMDAGARWLFATGHGVSRLLRYDVDDISRKPQSVDAETGNAQAFAQDQQAGEIYIYNADIRQLMVFDAELLKLNRTFAVNNLASGDPWLVVDHGSNAIVIVSEADLNDGVSFLTLDRLTGAERDRRDLEAGNLLLVSETSRLYMSFFRRQSKLIRYDLSTLSIDKEVSAPPRADRMAYLADRGEVLVTVPVASSIKRYDAETMDYKGEFRAIFGVRTLAIDKERRLLLSGSLATGEVAIIDLETLEVRSRHYLGPWLRTIALDERRGIAYVSSRGYLYELKYGQLQ